MQNTYWCTENVTEVTTDYCAITDNNKLYLRCALFWDIRQCIVVISCRRFGITYRSCFQGSRNPKKKTIFLEIFDL
jgi:hypothetical protein